jgi:hypothetical protein
MEQDVVRMFSYKGKGVYIKREKDKYIVGVCGSNNLYIWFDSVSYPTIKLAVTSGREYARIMIDKILLISKNTYVKKI